MLKTPLNHLDKRRFLYPERDLNPHSHYWPKDFKSFVSTISPSGRPYGKSGKRDSNSRPRPWQGRALPTELLPQVLKDGCKGKKFPAVTQLFPSKSWGRELIYRPNRAFSAVSIRSKWKPSIVSCIKAVMRSLHRLPMLPSCVWCTSLTGVNSPASISKPTFL